MTDRPERAEHTPDRAAGTAARKPGDTLELDAEIVKDLDADERADEVRGGCKTTLPCGTTTNGGY